MRTRLGFGAVLLLAACGGQKVDLGGTEGGAPPQPPDTGGPAADASPIDGIWAGYIESYQLPSGSDLLAMTFGSGGGDPNAMTFGVKSPPPPAQDPNVGYPAGFGESQGSQLQAFQGEGFYYTAYGVSFDGTRLQFGVVSRQLWAGWCALQTSYGQSPDGGGPAYGCLPTGGCTDQIDSLGALSCFLGSAPDLQPVDCGKMALCLAPGCGMGPVCSCSATGCAVDVTTPDITFDLQLSGGNKLDGSMAGTLGTHNVHLTKQD
jgi:hypothetical protein